MRWDRSEMGLGVILDWSETGLAETNLWELGTLLSGCVGVVQVVPLQVIVGQVLIRLTLVLSAERLKQKKQNDRPKTHKASQSYSRHRQIIPLQHN